MIRFETPCTSHYKNCSVFRSLYKPTFYEMEFSSWKRPWPTFGPKLQRIFISRCQWLSLSLSSASFRCNTRQDMTRQCKSILRVKSLRQGKRMRDIWLIKKSIDLHCSLQCSPPQATRNYPQLNYAHFFWLRKICFHVQITTLYRRHWTYFFVLRQSKKSKKEFVAVKLLVKFNLSYHDIDAGW